MTNDGRETLTTFADLGFPTPADAADRLTEQIIGPVFHLVEDMEGLLDWRDAIAQALRNNGIT